MENDSELISLDAGDIKRRIFTIRGRQVMLDSALAEYFGTTTGNLNRAMKRNIKRFPESFCFQLTDDEILRCQIGIPMQKRGIKGGRTYLPYVYTEQGIAMLTSVLHTERAIAASISIMEAFVEMRRFIANNAALFERISKVELKQLEADKKFDRLFEYVNTCAETKSRAGNYPDRRIRGCEHAERISEEKIRCGRDNLYIPKDKTDSAGRSRL